ncbi:MAG: PAS domain S-box protein, partial [Syntrophorhabdus sp.]
RIKELELSEAEHLRDLEVLRRSEMKFRTLYDSTSDAVILMDEKTLFDCNNAALKIFGCATQEELYGIHPADLSPLVQPCGTKSRVLGDRHIAMALKNGVHQFEWVHKRVDSGENFPADVLLSPMVIDGRTVLQAVIRDITQRKRTEEALLKEIGFNSTLVESSPAFFVAIHGNGTIRLMNDAMLRALGYTLEELINTEYIALVPEGDRELVSEVFAALITRGQATLNENRVLTKDGNEILVEWHGRAIKKPYGSLDYFFGVGMDITERKRAEAALRESEQRFRTVADSTPTALMLYQDDHWIFVNKAAEALTGYSAEELLQMKSWDIVHPDYKAFAKESSRKRQKGEQPLSRYELKITTKDGAERWAGLTAASAMIGGRPAGVISLADITERKAAEERLVKSEARYRSYFELPLVGMAITSPDKGWVEVNDRLCEILGYSREELVRMTWSELTHPDDLAWDVEQFSRVLKGHIDSYSMDKRFIRKQGEIIWTSLSVRCVRKPTGDVDYMVALLKDITVRKETEEALKESEEKFRLLFEQSVDPILLLHGETFIDCNEAAVRLVRCPGREDLVGLKPADISPERQPDGRLSSEKAREVIKRAFADGTNSFEWVHRTIGGEEFWVDVSLTVIPIQGKQILFTVWKDITKRKKAEQALLKAHEELEFRVQERTTQLTEAYGSLQFEMEKREHVEEQLRHSQKMQAIGTLAGGIAHDFNNILAAILGFTEMAIEDVADRPPVENNLRKVLKSAMRARDLVKQILAFSRKTNHERTPLSLSPLVEETVQFLRASIPANIEIKLAITARPDTILAAPTEVQQILMNLATNASLAMEEAGGILDISLNDIDFMPHLSEFVTDLMPGEYIQLMVKDTGAGMSPDVMRRIFEPFFTTRELGAGTGMGLAVVYGIVSDLEGTITVESEPGIGSTFRVFLPKIKTKVKKSRTKIDNIPVGTENVLFVDDEDMLVEWAK